MDLLWRELERLQPALRLSYQRLPVGRVGDLEAAFDALAREGAQALQSDMLLPFHIG